jgi:hypothetical protein
MVRVAPSYRLDRTTLLLASGGLLMRLGGITAVAVAVASVTSGCSASSAPSAVQPTPQVIYVTPAPVLPSTSAPSVVSTETPAPTEATTPEPTSGATQDDPIVHAIKRSYGGGIWVQIVVPVTNVGTTWIDIDSSQPDYTIYDKGGGVLGTGTFTYAYPTFLGPGQTGYLADTASIDGAKTTEVGKVETTATYQEVAQDDAVILTTAHVKNRNGTYGDNPTSTGTITNTSTTSAESAHVGAFYFDGSGRLLGFSSTNLIENLGANKTKGFETLAEYGPPFTISAIKKTIVLAGCDYCN